ncbi:MAG: deoxyguanosinetriphosphate triphosphohydrolase [Clostridia bacterium]|nr:deoxyguanosinetriphosphate triphosphohydrolase [Clostridia bacterium]
MNLREQTENYEESFLSANATLAKNSKGRYYQDELCPIRTIFQQDRDRIIHSKAFRMLKHKTQVFLSPNDDHYRTRLTHTLEVSQVARTISRALKLNEDLTEAIALAHDLGHTPFGHAGERALNDIMKGGFRHYEQGVRVVEKLEKMPRGLNLSYEVRNGILCHTKGKNADTLEGQVVRIADRIAYINHDIDDALTAGIIKSEDIPKSCEEILGTKLSKRINTLVFSLIENSTDKDLKMSEEVQEQFDMLHKFMYDKVYYNKFAREEEDKIPYFIESLFEYIVKKPDVILPTYKNIMLEEGTERAVCDFIASLSDQYAIKLFDDLFIPKAWDKI